MPKRLADTGLWKKRWFRQLSPAEKCAWEYLRNNCDAVGVWDPDPDVAEFVIGGKVDWGSLPAKVNGNLEILENGKWWLVDFARFSYGTKIGPDSESFLIRNIYKLLVSHGLYEKYLVGVEEYLAKAAGSGRVVDRDPDAAMEAMIDDAEPSTVGSTVDSGVEATVEPTVAAGVDPTVDPTVIRIRIRNSRKRESEGEGKKKVAPDVFMKPSELAELNAEYGEEIVRTKITELSNALGNTIPKGKYKDHKKTVNNWILRDIRKTQQKSNSPPGRPVDWKPNDRKCPKCGAPIAADMICDACGWGKQ